MQHLKRKKLLKKQLLKKRYLKENQKLLKYLNNTEQVQKHTIKDTKRYKLGDVYQKVAELILKHAVIEATKVYY